MPTRPRTECARCRDLTVPGSGYCEKHKIEAEARRAELDKARPTARERGYGRKWEAARLGHLKSHPFCVDCAAAGIETAATEVDHEIPHKGDMRIFWDKTNWRSRCKPCHSRKTATRDSRFARRGQRRAR